MGLGNRFFSLLTPNVRCKHTPPSPLNRWDEPQREAPHPYTPPHLPYSWHLPPFPLQATHVTHWFSSRVTATGSSLPPSHQLPGGPGSSLLSLRPRGPQEPLRSTRHSGCNRGKAPSGSCGLLPPAQSPP